MHECLRDVVFLGRHYDDTGFGDGVAGGAVGLHVETDRARFRDACAGVDYSSADSAVTADFHLGHQDRVLHFTIAIDAHTGRQHAAHDASAGDYTAGAHNGIERHAHASALLREHELGRRLLGYACANRPALIVQVEFRRHRYQIHVGFIVGVNSADIAPIQLLFCVHVGEIVGDHAGPAHQLGDDVAAEVVRGGGVVGILEEGAQQHVRIENINAHRSAYFLRIETGGDG